MESIINFIFYFVAAIFLIKGVIALFGLSIMAAMLLFAGTSGSSSLAFGLGVLAFILALILLMIILSIFFGK